MRYLSVCSGIEAASVAWPGWTPVAFSEIEPFPCAVLKHHYPDVPNLGDMTRYADWPHLAPDVVVGGTPCQSFSVAGLRAGLADPRGNLALVFLGVVDRYRPRWVVWENVPGVRSSLTHDAPDPCAPPSGMAEGAEWVGEDEYDADEVHAFYCFLAGLSELGYGWAYRSPDAQFFGLAQRRERVFVVGHLGDWRPSAAVLFEPESMRGDSPPSRETGEGTTRSVAPSLRGGGPGCARVADSRGQDPVVIQHCPEVSPAMKQRDHKGPSSDGDGDGLPLIAVTHALRADGFDASEDGTGRGTPLIAGTLKSNSGGGGFGSDPSETFIAIPLQEVNARQSKNQNGVGIGVGDGRDPMYTLQSGQQHGVAVAVAIRGRDGTPQIEMGDEVANAILTPNGGRGGIGVGATLHRMAVRRLTPRECERLQGFPDDHTLIPFRGKPAADGPRYKALGNSMAVPVVRWLGERIELVESTISGQARSVA